MVDAMEFSQIGKWSREKLSTPQTAPTRSSIRKYYNFYWMIKLWYFITNLSPSVFVHETYAEKAMSFEGQASWNSTTVMVWHLKEMRDKTDLKLSKQKNWSHRLGHTLTHHIFLVLTYHLKWKLRKNTLIHQNLPSYYAYAVKAGFYRKSWHGSYIS